MELDDVTKDVPATPAMLGETRFDYKGTNIWMVDANNSPQEKAMLASLPKQLKDVWLDALAGYIKYMNWGGSLTIAQIRAKLAARCDRIYQEGQT